MIQPGQQVYANDGELLGTVTEIGNAYVKISAQMSLDYWLPIACVHDSADTGVLRTTFPSGDLPQYRREPGSL